MSGYSGLPSVYKFPLYAAGVLENLERMNSIIYDLRRPEKRSPVFDALNHAAWELPQNRR